MCFYLFSMPHIWRNIRILIIGLYPLPNVTLYGTPLVCSSCVRLQPLLGLRRPLVFGTKICRLDGQEDHGTRPGLQYNQYWWWTWLWPDVMYHHPPRWSWGRQTWALVWHDSEPLVISIYLKIHILDSTLAMSVGDRFSMNMFLFKNGIDWCASQRWIPVAS